MAITEESERATVIAAVAALDKQADPAAKAKQYYDGQFEEVFASETIRKQLRASLGAYSLNIVAPVVDAPLDRLHRRSVTAEGAAGAVLDQIWADNDLAFELPESDRWTLAQGDGIILVLPVVDDQGEADNDDDEGDPVADGTAQVIPLRADEAVVVYDEEDRTRKAYGARRWKEPKRTRVDIYFPDRVEQWVLAEGEAKEWQRHDEDLEPFEPGVIPMFHKRTRRPYGVSKARDMFGPQNAVTKLAASFMAGVDFGVLPIRYTLGEDDAGLGNDWQRSGDSDGDDDDDNYRAEPGSLWKLQAKSVGEFKPFDLDKIMAAVDKWIDIGAALTGTPVHKFRGMSGAPSGAALNAGDSPLTAYAESAAAFLDAGDIPALEYACLVAGVPGATVTVEWEPFENADSVDRIGLVASKQALGVPIRHLLINDLGYPEDVVDKWLEDQAPLSLGPQELATLAQKLFLAVGDIADPASGALLSVDEGRSFLRKAGLIDDASAE